MIEIHSLDSGGVTVTIQVKLLEREIEAARALQDDRAVAELAFALATLSERQDDLELASEYAKESLQAAGRCVSDTLDDVVSQRLSVGGVSIPDLFHEGVVKARLAHLLKG